jgi:hypothetical protein
MELATGDLVLFIQRRRSAWWLLDKAIEMFTRSPYVHVGMVLVDPPFAVPRGTYLWEAGYESSPNPETGTRNLGVRLTEIGSAIRDSDVFVRKCTLRIAHDKLLKIHRDVFLKPYDVCLSDWLLATLRVDPNPQKTDRFWCSAFIAYVLTQLGWLEETTDWSIVRPCDLSSRSDYLSWDVAAAYTRDTPYRHKAVAVEAIGAVDDTNAVEAVDDASAVTAETEAVHHAEAVEVEAVEVEAVEAVRCDMLVAKLRSIGIEPKRTSLTDLLIKFPRGSISVRCSLSSFKARAIYDPREPREPRSFESQLLLVHYIRDILDAHLMAVIL